MGDMSILSHFNTWFNHLFISVCTHGYLFYTLGYNLVLLYYVWSNYSSSGHRERSRLSSLLLWYSLLRWVFVCVLAQPYFLAPWNALGSPSCSRCKINHFSEVPCFLLLQNDIRHHDICARRAHFFWDIISYRYSQLTGQENIYVYINVYIYIWVLICKYCHM